MSTKNENKESKEFSKYEVARIIGARALQLSMGAPFLIKLSDEELEKIRFNPLEIAKKEYAAGVLSIEVVRTLPEQKQEKK